MLAGDLLIVPSGEQVENSKDRLRIAFADGGPLEVPESEPKTLIAALLRTQAKYPDRGITFIDSSRNEVFQSYADLFVRAKRILTGLRKSGIQPRQGVILQIDNLEYHFAAFWACVLGGMIPVAVAIPPSYKQKDGVVGKLFHTWQLLDKAPILTNTHLLGAFEELPSELGMQAAQILSVDVLAENAPATELHQAHPDEPFFYQLTSGSTGVPKCIQETHRSVIAHLHGSRQFCNYGPGEVSFNWLPFDHVVPILTFHLRDLFFGYQQIHAKPDVVLSNPEAWLQIIDKHRVTLTWAPNFGFKRVTDYLKQHPEASFDLSCVKYFMNAGEQVTGPVVSEFLSMTGNFGVSGKAMQPAFGMAEVCTCMTYTNDYSAFTTPRRFTKASLEGVLQEVENTGGAVAEFVDLGAPIPGVAIRIADSKNQTLPEKVIGRLQIKGTVVTPGYLHNPTANSEAFVEDGWFNTGDLGFMLDGRLFLTGREKEMIVIRGAKFYCYEIEDVVNGISGVEPTYAAATSSGDPQTGTESLSIFFVPKPGVELQLLTSVVRAKVTETFGIAPGAVVALQRSEFPKTTSGKIQRTQLRKNLETGMYAERLNALHRACMAGGPAETEMQKQVAAIWKTVLGEADYGIEQSLFEVGADSLKASQIVSRVREQLGVTLPLPTIFEEARTIKGMAAWVEKLRATGVQMKKQELVAVPRTKPLPASYNQEQIWILDQMEPGTSLYNIARAVQLRGILDVGLLEQCLNQITERHEVLRTNLRYEDSLKQVIRPAERFTLPVLDLSHVSAQDRSAVAWSTAENEARLPFNITSGALFRAKLLRLSPEHHLLLLTFHQTVVDGWSVDVFLQELQMLYSALKQKEIPQLSKLPIQYADYAGWQRKMLQEQMIQEQIAFWKDRLSGKLPTLKLAGTGPQKITTSKARVETLTLDSETVARIRSFNRDAGSTMFITLLSAYNTLLAHASKQNEILVGIPKNNRNSPELEKTIGFFVNTLVLRTKLRKDTTFRDLVSQVRSDAIQAYAHSDVPFQKVVPQLRSAGVSSLFHVWFGAIDQLRPFTMGDVEATPMFVSPGSAQFDLAVFISEQAESVTCLFEYKSDVFSKEAISCLMMQYQQIVRTAADSPDLPLSEFMASHKL